MGLCHQDIQDLKSWIDNHQNYNLMVEDVVKKSGWSKWHLQREFTKQAGISIGKYVADRRMKEAERLLKDGKTKIIDVAGLAGYESVASFYRAFRNRFGCTPKQMAAGVEK